MYIYAVAWVRVPLLCRPLCGILASGCGAATFPLDKFRSIGQRNRIMKSFVIFAMYLLSFNCVIRSQTTIKKAHHDIKVYFKEDEYSIDTSTKFDIFVIDGRKTYKASVIGNNVILPKIIAKTKIVDVLFVFLKYKVLFKKVDIDMLYMDQNFDWTINLLNRNFNIFDIHLKSTNIRRLYVWEFNPLERGDGVMILNPIYKIPPNSKRMDLMYISSGDLFQAASRTTQTSARARKDPKTISITVSYAAIECGCPQWFETKFKKRLFLRGIERFYLEPTNKTLINANDLWDGQTLPLTLKVVGSFSESKEAPRTYNTKGSPEKARIFWYKSIIIVSGPRSNN